MEIMVIKYDSGSMTIDLGAFLGLHSTSKVRKLLRLIRSSFTPECEEQMKDFCQNQIEQFKSDYHHCEMLILDWSERVKYYEQQAQQIQRMLKWYQNELENLKESRDSHRSGTKVWKSKNETVKIWNKDQVKPCRSELKQLKKNLKVTGRQVHFYTAQQKRIVADSVFYKKVLIIISET